MKVYVTENEKLKDVEVQIHCEKDTSEIERLADYVRAYGQIITGKLDGEIVKVNSRDVLYFESVDDNTFIYTQDKVLTSTMKLYEIEEQFDKTLFFRCSKSTIINLSKITRLKPEFTRNILATLVNGEVIVISRRYAPELKKKLGI